eukprot:Tbor_TRINITY_DN2363_c0_g1::TRINITY_DN2363_c0_g1_i1::g.97::m.97
MSNESVYNIIQVPPPIARKNPIYRSARHGHDIPPTYSTFGTHGTSVICGNAGGYTDDDVPCAHPAKKAVGSFGRSVTDLPGAASYLKMSGNRGVQPNSGPPAAFTREEVRERRPDVIKRDDKPVMGLKSDKNFVTANAVENMISIPKPMPEELALGVHKSTFARVPEYIHTRKSQLHQHKELIQSMAALEAERAEVFSEVSASELKELLNSLRARWDMLNREFATMGFQVETLSKKKRQQQLELELRTIEVGLARLNRSRVIMFDDTK